MLLLVFFSAWVISLILSYPRFFTLMFFAGMMLQILAWIPLTAPIAFAFGWDNPNTITAKPVSLEWNTGFYDLGDTKSLTLEVTNNTGKFYSRFILTCYTPTGDFLVYDNNGIVASKQRDIRTYEVDSSVVTVLRCDTEQALKGKPKS